QQRPIVPGEGEAHFESVLHVVQELYNRHKSQYPSQTTSWAIFGRFEGTTAMPEKLAIAKRRFQAMGLPMKFAQYDIAKASERINPAAGTVVGVLQNRKRYLYVEDQVRDSINFNDQPRPTGDFGLMLASKTNSSIELLLVNRFLGLNGHGVLVDKEFWWWRL
ncbi:hypothetical protein B0A55_13472, partial [Friedmanniomyces simplex]